MKPGEIRTPVRLFYDNDVDQYLIYDDIDVLHAQAAWTLGAYQIKRALNAQDALTEVATAVQVLAEKSMAFRLALTSLPHNIGVELLEKAQAALALLEAQ